jgi:hypothetical protein
MGTAWAAGTLPALISAVALEPIAVHLISQISHLTIVAVALQLEFGQSGEAAQQKISSEV